MSVVHSSACRRVIVRIMRLSNNLHSGHCLYYSYLYLYPPHMWYGMCTIHLKFDVNIDIHFPLLERFRASFSCLFFDNCKRVRRLAAVQRNVAHSIFCFRVPHELPINRIKLSQLNRTPDPELSIPSHTNQFECPLETLVAQRKQYMDVDKQSMALEF